MTEADGKRKSGNRAGGGGGLRVVAVVVMVDCRRLVCQGLEGPRYFIGQVCTCPRCLQYVKQPNIGIFVSHEHSRRKQKVFMVRYDLK